MTDDVHAWATGDVCKISHPSFHQDYAEAMAAGSDEARTAIRGRARELYESRDMRTFDYLSNRLEAEAKYRETMRELGYDLDTGNHFIPADDPNYDATSKAKDELDATLDDLEREYKASKPEQPGEESPAK